MKRATGAIVMAAIILVIVTALYMTGFIAPASIDRIVVEGMPANLTVNHDQQTLITIYFLDPNGVEIPGPYGAYRFSDSSGFVFRGSDGIHSGDTQDLGLLNVGLVTMDIYCNAPGHKSLHYQTTFSVI